MFYCDRVKGGQPDFFVNRRMKRKIPTFVYKSKDCNLLFTLCQVFLKLHRGLNNPELFRKIKEKRREKSGVAAELHRIKGHSAQII